MSDQPGTRRPDEALQPPGETPARRSADDSSIGRSPLRTRQDPLTREGNVVRPPSREPSWNRDPTRRDRGTGRYAAPTNELPPAVLPDGAPSWMGQRDRGHDAGSARESVMPRPLSGAERRAEDYGTGWRDQGEPSANPDRSTGSWPAQSVRPPRTGGREPRTPVEDDANDPAAGRTDVEAGENAVEPAARRNDRSRPWRAPRGSGIALLEDGNAIRLASMVFVSAAAMWVLTRVLIGSVGDPLTLRLGVDGTPGTTGSSGTVWRVPFVATMLALMTIGTGLLVARRDLFAARFVLGSGVLVQALIWVAAITLLR